MRCLRQEFPFQHQVGISLIEVLIAVSILSFSLLGLAALQGFGLSFTHESYLRTQALNQAYDILDRMRANPVAEGNGSYLLDLPTDYPSACQPPATACGPNDLASYDLYEWQQANIDLLPGGSGAIQSSDEDSDGDNDIVVTVSWQEDQSASGDSVTNQFVLVVDQL